MLKVKFVTILLALLFSALLINAQNAKIDEAAPGFTLKDHKGNEHSLSDFSGKWVVLEWINYDCPFVKKHYESGNIPGLQKKYAEKDVVWLAICSSAPGKQGNFDPETIDKRSAEVGAAFSAYLLDESGDVGRAYGAKTTPHMYVINPEGTLLYAGGIDNIPSANKDDIAKATNYVTEALEAAMNGKEVQTKVSAPYGCSVKY